MMYSLRVIAHLFLCFSAGRSFATQRLFSRPVAATTSLFAAVATENSTSPVSTLAPQTTTSILADSHEFVKPDRDLREYRYIRLPNNLEALLVSTANTKTRGDEIDDVELELEDLDGGSAAAQVEAASVHVQAGHFDDTIPGLAHFHERKMIACGCWISCYSCNSHDALPIVYRYAIFRYGEVPV